jgi:hypothetical protein
VPRLPGPVFWLSREPPSLIVAKSEPSITDLLSKHSILFYQEFDDVLLMLVHPAGQRRDKE